MSQGIAPIPLVPVPRVGGFTVPRAPVLHALTTAARVGLSALVAVTLVGSAAVAMGRTETPLQALAAVRSPGTFPLAPAAGLPAAPEAVAVPVLKVGTVMNLPLAGVATAAKGRTATVVDAIERREAAERAEAARRAAAARAAAAAQAAAERAAAQRAAAQRAAAQRAANAAAARQAAAAAAAEQAAAEQAAARRAAARQAAARQAAAEAAAAEPATPAGASSLSDALSGG